MTTHFIQDAPNVPTDGSALKELHRHAEGGHCKPLDQCDCRIAPRYLVTYMSSQTVYPVRTATVVSVTNQSRHHNRVCVSYFKGLTSNDFPVARTIVSIPPDFTVDFGSREIPFALTVVNGLAVPQLVADEGRILVSSVYPEIGVSSRVYYTQGHEDDELLAITDSKVVVFGEGNSGD